MQSMKPMQPAKITGPMQPVKPMQTYVEMKASHNRVRILDCNTWVQASALIKAPEKTACVCDECFLISLSHEKVHIQKNTGQTSRRFQKLPADSGQTQVAVTAVTATFAVCLEADLQLQ